MLIDLPETYSTQVWTPEGEIASKENLDSAVKLAYARGFAAKSMCPNIGSCAIRVNRREFTDEDGGRVDEYFLICEKDCPLLIKSEITQ